MNEATLEELRERYRKLPVEELLVLAADSSQLTPAAAKALHQELKERKLSQRDVAETRARVNHWRAEEDEYKAVLFDPWRKIVGAFTELAHLLVMGCLWLLLGAVARWFFRSSDSAKRFQEVGFIACFVPYVLWRVGSAVKKVRRKKLLDNAFRSSSEPHSVEAGPFNRK
jgi:hypothetical protein